MLGFGNFTYGVRSLNSLSLKLYLKRKSLRWLGHHPENQTSIMRRERPPVSSSSKMVIYSTPKTIEIFDPRNGITEGHYFNPRLRGVLKEVVLEPFQGLIYSKSGELIRESTNLPHFQAYDSFPLNLNNSKYTLRKIPRGIFLPSNSYWHWIVEDLPLFIRSIEFFPDFPIIVSKRAPRYVLELLASQDRTIIFASGLIQVGELGFHGKSGDAGWPHPEDVQILGSSSLLHSNPGDEATLNRIFISRIGDRRSPRNERMLVTLFQDLGFKVINTSSLNIFEEVKLFENVDLIAGVHGAGLVNMVWSKKRVRIFDIVNEYFWTESGFRLAALIGAQYGFSTYKGKSTDPLDLEKVYQDFLDWEAVVN